MKKIPTIRLEDIEDLILDHKCHARNLDDYVLQIPERYKTGIMLDLFLTAHVLHTGGINQIMGMDVVWQGESMDIIPRPG